MSSEDIATEPDAVCPFCQQIIAVPIMHADIFDCSCGKAVEWFRDEKKGVFLLPAPGIFSSPQYHGRDDRLSHD